MVCTSRVEARKEPRAACQGPGNMSMEHIHEPSAMVNRSGQKHWSSGAVSVLDISETEVYRTIMLTFQWKQYMQLPKDC
jgi:hypothetical protein